jgi:hypothetical protein
MTMRILSAIFLIVILAGAAVSVQAAAEGAQDSPADDDFSPGLFAGVLIMLLIFLAMLVVLGLLALGLFLLLFALVTLGLISSSVVYGVTCRRPSAALQALVVQAGALAGTVLGAVVFWTGDWLFKLALAWQVKLLAGAAIGLACGILLGLLINFLVRRLYGYVSRRWEKDTGLKCEDASVDQSTRQ